MALKLASCKAAVVERLAWPQLLVMLTTHRVAAAAAACTTISDVYSACIWLRLLHATIPRALLIAAP